MPSSTKKIADTTAWRICFRTKVYTEQAMKSRSKEAASMEIPLLPLSSKPGSLSQQIDMATTDDRESTVRQHTPHQSKQKYWCRGTSRYDFAGKNFKYSTQQVNDDTEKHGHSSKQRTTHVTSKVKVSSCQTWQMGISNVTQYDFVFSDVDF